MNHHVIRGKLCQLTAPILIVRHDAARLYNNRIGSLAVVPRSEREVRSGKVVAMEAALARVPQGELDRRRGSALDVESVQKGPEELPVLLVGFWIVSDPGAARWMDEVKFKLQPCEGLWKLSVFGKIIPGSGPHICYRPCPLGLYPPETAKVSRACTGIGKQG